MAALERRKLKFETLDEAVRDAERLLAAGYDRCGAWDLGQCCRHLAVLMTYPLDGFPPFRFPINLAAWALKHTAAPAFLKRVLDSGVWPEGRPTDKRTIPPPGGSEEEAVEELRRAAQRLASHEGPLQPSPLFGMLDKPTLLRLHRIHAAHHLSFLSPRR